MSYKVKSPVAMLVFNRPEHTRRVFAAVRDAQPARLLLVADGPRASRAGEAERCRQVREIVQAVDWPCEVMTNFADRNLGCRVRVSSGLDWVFQSVEEAIILEDDCLPHPSFFRFCDEMLDRYRDDPRVGIIAGINHQPADRKYGGSYYFSRYAHVWGWASWRRTWQLYDVSMSLWPMAREFRLLESMFLNPAAVQHWRRQLDLLYDGHIDTWDYQLTFMGWVQHLLHAVPCRNLVTNLGFDADATHTRERNQWAELPAEEISFPLVHPEHRIRDALSDAYIELHHFSGTTDRVEWWTRFSHYRPWYLFRMLLNPAAHYRSWKENRDWKRNALTHHESRPLPQRTSQAPRTSTGASGPNPAAPVP